MKTNHITTAVKALQKQLEKYRDQQAKAITAAREAQLASELYGREMQRLQEQIQALEGHS